MPPLDTLAGLDQLFVQQKFAPVANLYRISTVAADGKSAGEPLCFVRQKRLKIKEQITFYADEEQREPVLEIRARKVFEVRGMYDVLLPGGEVVGGLRKVFGASLLRSKWEVLDVAGNPVARAQESSLAMAMLRRVWSLVPYAGDVPFFLPFHFTISAGEREIGRYRRLVALRDRYVLDLSADTERVVDRRLALALTIALDALQSR